MLCSALIGRDDPEAPCQRKVLRCLGLLPREDDFATPCRLESQLSRCSRLECLPTSEGKGESSRAEGFGDDAARRWEASSCMRFAEEAYARETDFALLFDLLLDDRLRTARLLL